MQKQTRRTKPLQIRKNLLIENSKYFSIGNSSELNKLNLAEKGD